MIAVEFADPAIAGKDPNAPDSQSADSGPMYGSISLNRTLGV
jgi:hypothetical protein